MEDRNTQSLPSISDLLSPYDILGSMDGREPWEEVRETELWAWLTPGQKARIAHLPERDQKRVLRACRTIEQYVLTDTREHSSWVRRLFK